ncbi:discoidin domain-containing protein [Sphingomonas sp. 22176]|uniref:discoidin domain-containing protein n=1 Tax=Sphingomonas sp. 22176 TaxID=3453884 RepID=UPI003F85BCD9
MKGLSFRARTAIRRMRALALAPAMVTGLFPGVAEAQLVTVQNKLANHYAYDPLPDACPNGHRIANIPEGYRTERDHVIYNDSTHKWVMWAHYEASGYGTAQALVAQSDTECGPYTIVKTFRPLDREIRDDYVWKDNDGTAYFLAASRKNGGANDTMAIFRLTANYLDVDVSAGTTWAFENQYREAPIVMKKGNIYFLLTSAAAGWYPSQGAYATATSMLGPWSPLANFGNASTFGGQNADVRIIRGSGSTANILVLDHLGGAIARDDGRMWLPVLLDDQARTATLDYYSTFYVDKTTGALTLPSTDSVAATRPATASATASGSSPQYGNDRSYQTKWSAVSSANWPAWWRVDLGSARHVGEIQISWPMTKGSEAYYKYKIEFSSDGTTWQTYDFTNNTLYGFTVDSFNVTARFIRVQLVTAVLSNNPNNWYTPALWNVRVLN